MESAPMPHQKLTDEEVKQIINDIDTKLYVLNEAVYDQLAIIHELHQKLRQHFCPELYTEVKMSMGDLTSLFANAYTKELSEKLRAGEPCRMQRPELPPTNPEEACEKS